jgi:hydroxyacylglutathione hydrolase
LFPIGYIANQIRRKAMALVAEDNEVSLFKIVLGPYATNTYAAVNKETHQSVLFDAPDEWEKIMALLYGTDPLYIFITHAHLDHTGALQDVVRNIRVDYGTGHDFEPICVAANLNDHPKIPTACHMQLENGDFVRFGKLKISVLHTPGHTPGSVCLRINKFLIAGDTLFPGGPGHTDSPAAFETICRSITERIFTLPDDTLVFPGHGESTTVGTSKQEYAVFASHSHPASLYGDVAWLDSK